MGMKPDDFLQLMVAVEAQGGKHLLDVVHASTYETYDDDGFNRDARYRGYQNHNCDETTLFEVPYELERGDTVGRVTVCALDDMMDLWPRFRELPEVD